MSDLEPALQQGFLQRPLFTADTRPFTLADTSARVNQDKCNPKQTSLIFHNQLNETVNFTANKSNNNSIVTNKFINKEEVK